MHSGAGGKNIAAKTAIPLGFRILVGWAGARRAGGRPVSGRGAGTTRGKTLAPWHMPSLCGRLGAAWPRPCFAYGRHTRPALSHMRCECRSRCTTSTAASAARPQPACAGPGAPRPLRAELWLPLRLGLGNLDCHAPVQVRVLM